jgi:hypothetical protein
MTDWSQLEDAGGSAAAVPEFLDRVEPGPSPVWDELWTRLCPQGAVFSASLAAIPRLTDIAAGWPPPVRAEPLMLAGAILGSEEQYHQVFDVQERYSAQLATLRRLVDETLQAAAGSDDTETYVYLLQALMAFDSIDVWDSHLNGLVTQEYEIECPGCSTNLFITLGDDGYFATHEDYAIKDDAATTALLPADPADLDGAEATLHALAVRDGHNTVAFQLTHIFGRAICSDCGTALSISKRIAAAAGHAT